jgi:hypothetical protein
MKIQNLKYFKTINSSIKATTLLLKGLEGEKEAKIRKERSESEGIL